MHPSASASALEVGSSDGTTSAAESPAPRSSDPQYGDAAGVGGRGGRTDGGGPGGAGRVVYQIGNAGWVALAYTGDVQMFTV